jgi:hypothetical protein
MLAAVTGEPMSEKFGIILGGNDRVEFRVEDFIHYYRRIKRSLLAMQDGYTGDMADRPEPMPRAEHGRWSSLAEKFFSETDHPVQVAGISVRSRALLVKGEVGASPSNPRCSTGTLAGTVDGQLKVSPECQWNRRKAHQ